MVLDHIKRIAIVKSPNQRYVCNLNTVNLGIFTYGYLMSVGYSQGLRPQKERWKEERGFKFTGVVTRPGSPTVSVQIGSFSARMPIDMQSGSSQVSDFSCSWGLAGCKLLLPRVVLLAIRVESLTKFHILSSAGRTDSDFTVLRVQSDSRTDNSC
jgi:hypothetical protein